MPRLVRRAPLSERIKAYLDPLDWLMWAQEELNSNDWEDFAKNYAFSIGLAMNFVFVLAKANAGPSRNLQADDVFLEAHTGSGWLRWFVNLVVTILTLASFLNGFFTFYRKRHYRLFAQPVEAMPTTPSARRVRIDSSPVTAGSPLRFLQKILPSNSAESRAHPDAANDVWEIAVWDPNPLCLAVFCLFSPLHVILYSLSLPAAPLDPRPSVTMVTTIFIAAVVSFQMYYMRSSFMQQAKDNAIIQREVLNEYDSKFVHPALQRPSRDVGIQTISMKRTRDSSVGVSGSSEHLASEVVTYTPKVVMNRRYTTKSNQTYSSQSDPDPFTTGHTPSYRAGNRTPRRESTHTTPTDDLSSPIRPSETPNPFRRAPQTFRPTGTGDGGSLGVYSHVASPLRKSQSANLLRDREDRGRDSLGGMGERRVTSPVKRDGSPLKRTSTPGGFGADRPLGQAERFGRSYAGSGVGRRESGRF
ncbi:hypothetical protein BS50DRAFT_572486 [Corynespora cassiicola Philippines]|uniref:Meiotically up-regulated gene 154 protein n=1 Tax=Corynespora cassiicola Philippines TaxID=1448308 RepID=A0A2T2NVM6_CORCC|nr:hypothetical protein BS50DRAFT_572486 [Corynespora cassiicola Philippines]